MNSQRITRSYFGAPESSKSYGYVKVVDTFHSEPKMFVALDDISVISCMIWQ